MKTGLQIKSHQRETRNVIDVTSALAVLRPSIKRFESMCLKKA